MLRLLYLWVLCGLAVGCGRVEHYNSQWKSDEFRSPDGRFLAVLEELKAGKDSRLPEKFVSIAYKNAQGREVEEIVFDCMRYERVKVVWTGPTDLRVQATNVIDKTSQHGPIRVTFERIEQPRNQTTQPGATDNPDGAQ